MLDIFRNDIFSVTSLTDAINKLPFIPGRLGSLVDWRESGVMTTSIVLESKDGVLTFVNPTARGGPGESIGKRRRDARQLRIPHYQRDDGVYADEVQGVRAFGQESQLQTVQDLINDRMAVHTSDFDTTLEYQRLGAVTGLILNGDGTTLYNLYAEFGISAASTINFDLNNASPVSGALRKKCAQTVRAIMKELGGTPISGVHAVCGDEFFDELIANVEVVNSYKNTPMAEVLRQGYVYPDGNQVFGAFEFGGIVWENYRGAVNSTDFVPTDNCYLFPVGPNLFKTTFAPADYMETVNTIGKPRYAKQFPWPNDKGVQLEMQMNALSYCTRPNALRKGVDH